MKFNTQQLVQDLCWVVNSPSLLYSAKDTGPKLTPNDVDQDELSRHFSQVRPFRVGQYFELLIEYWLRYHQQVEIVEQQKQLFANRQTVGELDFLFHDSSGDLVHLEAAVKFYLHFAGEHRSGSHYLGPNSRDHFERKTNRLFGHQLRLGRQFFPEVHRTCSVMKGWIFYHILEQGLSHSPLLLNPDHLHGHWMYESELEWFQQQSIEFRYTVSQKPFWLTAAWDDSEPSLISKSDNIIDFAEKHFSEQKRPLLVNRWIQNGYSWSVVDRLFIVANSWPHRPR